MQHWCARMIQLRFLIAAATVAMLVLGCGNVAVPVSLRTPAQAPQACMEALMVGTLAKHPQTGLGIAGADGIVMPVEWPFKYSARFDASGIALVNESGDVVAHEGDRIEVGGGMGAGPAPNAVWFACGPVAVAQRD
jgi:hypothetical protein